MAKAKEKGPLFIVGLGLCDENDLPARSLEVLRACSAIYAESYTNLMREGTLERLEKKIGRPIVRLGREEVEGEKKIIASALAGPTAFLAPGDPMTATTHESLRQSAQKANIRVKILHASSIFTAAAGAAGLQIYKFGKTATIAYWRKNFEPTSFVDLLSENASRGAHTLCLLDIDVKLGPMAPSAALDLLQKAQALKIKDGTLSKILLAPDTPVFVLWRVGWPEEKIWAGKMGDYPFSVGHPKEPPGPAVIIVPGKMHFSEEDSWKAAQERSG